MEDLYLVLPYSAITNRMLHVAPQCTAFTYFFREMNHLILTNGVDKDIASVHILKELRLHVEVPLGNAERGQIVFYHLEISKFCGFHS